MKKVTATITVNAEEPKPPTFEDLGFVQVVHCKDCDYGEKVNSVYLCGKIRGFGIAHEPDWFCADGERKEGR